MECHQPYDVILAMTLPEVAMLYEYTGKHPPVSWLVARYLRVKPKAKPGNVEQDMKGLLDLFGGPGKI